jgi:hypothetical protein
MLDYWERTRAENVKEFPAFRERCDFPLQTATWPRAKWIQVRADVVVR